MSCAKLGIMGDNCVWVGGGGSDGRDVQKEAETPSWGAVYLACKEVWILS